MKLLATATAMAFFLAGCATTGSNVHSKAAQIGALFPLRVGA